MSKKLLDDEQKKKIISAEWLWRISVLEDTVNVQLNTEEKRRKAHEFARQNREVNKQKADKTVSTTPPQVSVLQGDWGEITGLRTKQTGAIYAVLNMANASCPGGGYLEGMVAQEENMFRRTDCHFYVSDDQLDGNRQLYNQETTQLINGEFGRVYLDIEKPRVCIKGKENQPFSGYEDLLPEQYFEFYELKSAADDLRKREGELENRPFNPESMRKKIAAQLDTLNKAKVRHVILSAFGCGAFLNPASEVAKLYKEELLKRPGYFDEVTFAIYYPGYGNNNFTPFHEILEGVSLGTKPHSIEDNNTNSKLKTGTEATVDSTSRQPDQQSNQTNPTLVLASQPNQINSTPELPKEEPSSLLDETMDSLIQTINSSKWNDKGFVLPFFNFKKVPHGILELRDAVKKTKKNPELLVELKRIAQYRLDHYPLFTKRDEEVAEFYYQITQINLQANSSQMQLG